MGSWSRLHNAPLDTNQNVVALAWLVAYTYYPCRRSDVPASLLTDDI